MKTVEWQSAALSIASFSRRTVEHSPTILVSSSAMRDSDFLRRSDELP